MKNFFCMKKCIVALIALGFTVGMLPLQASAATTLGTVDWQISSVTDMDNNSVPLQYPNLSLDVDMGRYYLSVYGSLCSEDNTDCIAGVTGSGYATQSQIILDVRGGTMIYRIILDLNTLSGMCALYDYKGDLKGVGSIDFVALN